MQAGDGRVIPSFCIAALRGEPLTVFGDGSQTRSFCYVDDLIDGLMRFATRPGLAGRVLNVGGTAEHTIRELAQTVARIAGVPLETVSRARPADDPVRRRPDITLAHELLEWEPAVALDEGLRRTLEFFRSASATV
jgi:UDP-glucuronate decarboxylase